MTFYLCPQCSVENDAYIEAAVAHEMLNSHHKHNLKVIKYIAP